MPGRHSRNKGARFEREIVNLLRQAGYTAERIPLSGAMGTFKGDVQWQLRDQLLRIECKSKGNGFKFLYDKLSGNDILAIRADHESPLVVLSLDRLLSFIRV